MIVEPTWSEFTPVTVVPGTSDAPYDSWQMGNVSGGSWSNDATEDLLLIERQYVIGLGVLLVMILLGVVASVLMCLTLHRNPILWSEVFGGLKPKTTVNGRGGGRFPRRVRFNVPVNRDPESTGAATTVIISDGGKEEADSNDQT